MDLLSCLCWGTSDDENAGEVADLDPVLLVSGIGGSILHSKKKGSKSEIRVWVRIFLANLAFRQSLWSLYNPKTGKSTLFLQFQSCLIFLEIFVLSLISEMIRTLDYL